MPSESSLRLRIMTQNIWATDGDWPARREWLCATIREARPDILALQEVTSSNEFDQLPALKFDWLKHWTHQIRHVGADAPEVRKYGMAVASRFPFRVVGHLDLRCPPDAMERYLGALAITFDFGAKLGELLVVAAKPSWQLEREWAREDQAVRLAQFADQHRGSMPTILLGDFDATPDSASIRFLTGRQSLSGKSFHYVDAWDQQHPTEPGYTWTTENPTAVPEIARIIGPRAHHRRIDYILVATYDLARSVDVRINSCEIVTGMVNGRQPPSDHYGVLAELEFSVRPPVRR